MSNWEGSGITDSGAWDGSLGASLTVDGTRYLQGNHSLKVEYTGENNKGYVYENIGQISGNSIYIRVALRLETINSAAHVNPVALHDENVCGEFGTITLDGVTGTIQVWYLDAHNNPVKAGSDFTYALDTWYQVEAKWTFEGTVTWKVWNAAGTSLVHPEQTSATNAGTCLWDQVRVGTEAGYDFTFFVDSFAAKETGYPGPYKP
jgi:hypothetical protein